MSSTGPGNRAVLTHAGAMPAAGSDITYTRAKSLLSQGRRQALSSVMNSACPADARSEKQGSVDCTASPKKAITCDGAKVQSAEMHCASKQSCLGAFTPEVVMPKEVTQGPEEEAANLSIEVMHLKLDCSDELYKLSEGESLAVEDTPEEDVLFSQLASCLEDKPEVLPAWPELESSGPQCSTPDWREPLPELAVPELEDEDSDAADVSDIETMHPCSDDEHLYELPEEFQLDDKLLAVLRGVRGVDWHQKLGVPVRMPSTPPEFAPLPSLETGCLHEEFVDLDALDMLIPEDTLQLVPLE